jgi:hypothetical protein
MVDAAYATLISTPRRKGAKILISILSFAPLRLGVEADAGAFHNLCRMKAKNGSLLFRY